MVATKCAECQREFDDAELRHVDADIERRPIVRELCELCHFKRSKKVTK